MEIGIISFSQRGFELGETLKAGLEQRDCQVSVWGKGRFSSDTAYQVEESVGQWTGNHFGELDAFIFVGACGIAVRSIAPYIRHKTVDPAVVVVDEKGRFAISLLSGHIGGGNHLAQTVAEIVGAQPVVTTATDLNQVFAVDMFAQKNGCYMADMKYAKEISARLLEGKPVGFQSDFPWVGDLPRGLVQGDPGEKPELGIALTASFREHPFLHTLYLIPRVVSVGIGCRKGTPKKKIEEAVRYAGNQLLIPVVAFEQAASIDLKKDEPGIVDYCRERQIPYVTFSAEELNELEGQFTPSPFVESVAGVDNVCERSALRACGKGRIILRKMTRDGVTVALAMKKWSPVF